MKTFINTLFYFCLCFILIGLILTFWRVPGHALVLTLGLFGVIIFIISKTIKSIIRGSATVYSMFSNLAIIAVSIMLFIKYLHWYLFDYFSLIAVAVFFIAPFLYVFGKRKANKSIFTSKKFIVYILYSLAIIPLFFEIEDGPNMLVHPSVYNKLYDVRSHPSNVKIACWSDSSKPYMDTAENFYRRNEVSEAIIYFRKALAIEPNNYLFHFRISEFYLKTLSINEALQQLDTAIQLNPEFQVAYVNRGLIKYKLADNNGALKDLNIATVLDHTDPIAYVNKVHVLRALGKVQEACLNIDTANILNTNNDPFMAKEIMDEKKRCNCYE